MQPTPFNIIDVWSVIKKQWKFIAAFVLAAVILALITLFFVPKYYKSSAIVVAANPQLTDKARLFNPNIEALYSSFGSAEDLDRLYGIADLDTTYKILVDEFNLIKYYRLRQNNQALNRMKAVLNLRDDVELSKTELNQLKISVWTKDKNLSAQIANRMTGIVHAMAKGIWRNTYQTSLTKLYEGVAHLEQEVDSIDQLMMMATITPQQNERLMSKRSALMQQIATYYKSIPEFELVIATDPPALYVIEAAYPSAKADKPKKLKVLLAVLFTSFVFASLIALLQNKKPSMHVA